VDTDLRRPSFAGTFALHGPLGLLQVLVGSTKPENALRRTKIDGLSILPAFDTPPNPSELLSSARMAELVQQLSQDHVVILDAPPVLPVTDAVVLSHLADSIVVVVSAGRTRAEQLEHAIASIERGEGKISGIVLNRASSTKLSRLRYGDAEYGYSQSEYGTQHDSQGVMTPTSSAHRGAQPAQSDGRQADRRPVDKGESQLHQPPEDVSETRRMPVVSLAKSGQLEHDNAELELNDTFAHTELGRRPLWRDSPKRS
ncbi:MAG: CpsD/CapB family tyrosine-protein kinase, partial [Acidipropionibacterium jensenii]|nr:CpsD/CapB family tyrosine-protein kinase [Acidipropionibacterium jensenii]